MTLLEYYWKSFHQIVMLSPGENKENSDIVGWGSGFILKYNERFFLLLAIIMYILMIMNVVKERE